MGFVRVQDASEILELSQVKPIDLVTNNNKRNAFRKIEYNSSKSEASEFKDIDIQ
jgi:hypothetical protein